LKEAREIAAVTLVGRLFHSRAAVTRKDQSPMVRSRILGTIRRRWELDRSRRSEDTCFSTFLSESLVISNFT